jgi:hypothetical protein
VSLVACGSLDPIVSPDATVDAETLDGTAPDSSPIDSSASDTTSSDGSAFDGSDGAVPFACGKVVCDAKTHYCEKKSVGDGGADAGSKPDGGVEVDTCVAYPPNCADDGGKANCACIAEPCTCMQSGDQITVTCP